jgi:hypothetical protein
MKCVRCGEEMEDRSVFWRRCRTKGCRVFDFHESFRSLGHNTVKHVVPPEEYEEGTIFRAVPVPIAMGLLWVGEKEAV